VRSVVRLCFARSLGCSGSRTAGASGCLFVCAQGGFDEADETTDEGIRFAHGFLTTAFATALQRLHNGFTTALQRLHNGLSAALQRLCNGFATALQRLRLCNGFTTALRRLCNGFTTALQRLCNVFTPAVRGVSLSPPVAVGGVDLIRQAYSAARAATTIGRCRRQPPTRPPPPVRAASVPCASRVPCEYPVSTPESTPQYCEPTVSVP
jgi:hypothetical protein